MKPPVCRICGEPHWSNEPHKFKGVKPAPGAAKARKEALEATRGEIKRIERRITREITGRAGPNGGGHRRASTSARRRAAPSKIAPMKQRWARKKFNLYMKSYMREYRKRAGH